MKKGCHTSQANSLQKDRDFALQSCQIDEDYFITNFADVVKELGLKKKRYASGNFYFGIVRKNTEPSS